MENKILKEFFITLNRHVRYSLLIREKELNSPFKGDIDIVVENISKFEEFLKRYKIAILQKIEHHYKGIHYFIRYKNSIISVDVYEDYIISNRSIFDKKFFLQNVEFIKGIPFLSEEKYVEYYFIKKIIKGDLNKYISYFRNKREIVDNFLPNYFSQRNIKKLKRLMEGEILDIDYGSLIKSLRIEIIRKKPLNIFSIFYEPIRVFKRIVKPTGLIIAFLGPDGVGKSTIINRLIKSNELPFRRVEYFHLKPGILDRKKDVISVTKPHSKPVYKGLKSYMKLVYFALDYILGFWLKIYPLKVKSTLILFDRYYDDIYIDFKRYRYGGSLKLAKFFRFLIPKPDIYIILTAEAEIIYDRKKEVQFEELVRQISEYKQLNKLNNAIIVDTKENLHNVYKTIKNIIIKNLQEKWKI